MKRILLAVLLVLGPAQMALATTFTQELIFTSGGSIATSSGTNVLIPNFDGWNIVATGTSLSPSLSPVGLELGIIATCGGGGCLTDDLKITLSDINFTQTTPSFIETFSGTISAGGSVSQSAWDSTTNTLVATTTLIGALGPFSSTVAAQTSGGGPAGPGAYSLTMTQTITHGTQLVSLDGQIMAGAVPEPGSGLLLGSGLAGLAWRRWKAA